MVLVVLLQQHRCSRMPARGESREGAQCLEQQLQVAAQQREGHVGLALHRAPLVGHPPHHPHHARRGGEGGGVRAGSHCPSQRPWGRSLREQGLGEWRCRGQSWVQAVV